MEDIDLLAFGGALHGSEAMFRRRLRILDEVRKMIAEKGLEGVNIRTLSQKADVSQKTLYNAFKNKDNMIALAIRSYFYSYLRRLVLDSDPETLEGAMERQVTLTLRNLQIKNYLVAIASIYFSSRIAAGTHEVLTEIGRTPYVKWLNRVDLSRDLKLEPVLADLSNLQYAKVHEWGIGMLSDDQFVVQTMRAVFTYLSGALQGADREALADLQAQYLVGDALGTAVLDRANRKLASLTTAKKK